MDTTEKNTMETTVLPGEIDILTIDDQLLLHWLSEFEEIVPNQTVHREAWTNTILEARKSQKPILFLGLGCLDWVTVAGSDGKGVDIVQEIRNSGRPRQFAKSMGEMQRALSSFGVQSVLFLSLSNIDPLISAGRGAMGTDFDTASVSEIFENSQRTMSELIQKAGGIVRTFNHFKVVANSLGIEHPEEVFSNLSGGNEIDIETFLFRLYRRDVRNLPLEIMDVATGEGIDAQGAVWVDIMSPLAGEHREHMVETVTECCPDLPVVNPFKNSGKWNTRMVARERFPDKMMFVSKMLNTNPISNRVLWMRQILSKSDAEIASFLESLGVPFNIDSMQSKNEAAELIEHLMWGDTVFMDNDLMQQVDLPQGATLQTAVSTILGQTKSHAKNLIEAGAVRIDGIQMKEFGEKVPDGATITVGKKTKAKVKISNLES